VVAALLADSLGVSAALGSTAGSLPATVVTREVGRVPAGFLGLSLEIRGVEAYTGFDSGAVNPVFEQLVRNLDPRQRPVLRLGGDTSDWTWVPIPNTHRPVGVRYSLTGTWFKVVRELAKDVDARLVVGVNFEVDSARVAAAEARAIVNGIGSPWLEALELGNEPELYSVFPWFELHHVPHYGRPKDWSFSAYLNDYATIARALPRFSLAGPDVGSPAFVDGIGVFLSREPRVRIATVHRYPLGCDGARPTTIAELLSNGATRDFAAGFGPALAAAHAHGIPLRLDEMGTVSCGGQAGLSDTFAAALWNLDVLFELTRDGFAGVNIHSRVGVPGELFSFRRAGQVWQGHVAPDYYGLLAFAAAAPAGARLLGVVGVPEGPLHVWATEGPDRTERVVLINLAPRHGRVVAVRAGSRKDTATLERLTAPRAGATGRVTLGGQSFGTQTHTGILAGRLRAVPVSRSGRGTYRVWMPAVSAAILRLARREHRACSSGCRGLGER
jgi:hypothetical protein